MDDSETDMDETCEYTRRGRQSSVSLEEVEFLPSDFFFFFFFFFAFPDARGPDCKSGKRKKDSVSPALLRQVSL